MYDREQERQAKAAGKAANRRGRQQRFTLEEQTKILLEHALHGKSVHALAQHYHVSGMTIYRIINP